MGSEGLTPTNKILEAAIRKHIAAGAAIASTHVIPGNDDGPAPKEAYATVLLITAEPDGQGWSKINADTLTTVDYLSMTATYSVQFYRAGARDCANRLLAWLSASAGHEAAEARGLTYIRASGIRQLDGIVSAEWEERASVDLMFGYVSVLQTTVALIDSVGIEVNGVPIVPKS